MNDDYDEDDLPQSRRRRQGFRCPYCGSREPPVVKSQIAAAGWVLFVVFLLFCFPLFWIGLLITENYRVCYDCGIRLGG